MSLVFYRNYMQCCYSMKDYGGGGLQQNMVEQELHGVCMPGGHGHIDIRHTSIKTIEDKYV